ncbi:MFS general substrate transporter [Mycena olivaceomarginata]|nr:MFS general substrate transporter [Mycena olivaceomarginata]
MTAFEKGDDEIDDDPSHLASSSHHLNNAPQFPEGCTKGYLTIFGALMALFCTFGQMNAFQAWYAEHQLNHLEPSTIAWIGSLQLWVFFSGGPIGRLFDAYWPRISTQYYQYLLAHGVLFGLGVGMLFYPSLSSVSTYFCKYRATALGVVATGSSFGGVMYPIMLQRLFQLRCVVCCIAILTMTRHAPPKQRGATCKLSDTFRDSRFVLLAAGSSLVALGLFIPFFYIVDYAHDPRDSAEHDLHRRIAPAYLSDKIGRFNLLAPAAFLSGLLCVLFWVFARSLVLLMLFAAAYGFTSGAFISVITPCFAQISDIRQIGSRIGILYSIISFPSLVGGPAAGALLEADNGQYTGMILFAGLTVIAGSFLILAAKLKIDSRILGRV